MDKQSLNKNWNMLYDNKEWLANELPVSMYSVLLKNGAIDDPYYRENEEEACTFSEKDCSFYCTFTMSEQLKEAKQPVICFEAIDTLAEVFLNGKSLGYTNNMYRMWEFDITDDFKEGENVLRVDIKSPLPFMKKKIEERNIWGVSTTIPGYQYIRKAHYMFGWDWGPKLPDMGIYRNVYIYDKSAPRILDYHFTQKHVVKQKDTKVMDNKALTNNVKVVGTMKINLDGELRNTARAIVSMTDSKGMKYISETTVSTKSLQLDLNIDEPRLWWPNGLGKAELYDTTITLLDKNNKILDEKSIKLGLRTLELSRDKDEWGEEFCFKVNGEKIFAMGADYIPEDQIIPRLTKEKTQNLLQHCIKANYNCIRVWGGGYYPEDWFYEICDEFGLIVWQDFMYACAVYVLSDDFKENITIEAIENIKRLRNHPSLGLWCGNNEMETAWENWGLPQEEDLKADYVEMFEHLLRDLTNQYDGVTPYWRSSPYSGDTSIPANDFNYGDVHYWDVWHGLKPMSDAFNHYFRFCSEYGFESIPSLKTLETVLLPEDYNLYSPAMENHQKCESGNMKLNYYLSEYLRYPVSFTQLIYATQVLQAEAIRHNVEHMRRNRGRCMGSVYWQVNDTNPVISWASIDYYNRWKALHYFCRRFYAPVLLSAWEKRKNVIQFNISNETFNTVEGILKWNLRNNKSEVIQSGQTMVKASRMSAMDVLELDLNEELTTKEIKRNLYLEYSLIIEGRVISYGSSQFVEPKHYNFLSPDIQVGISENEKEFILNFTAKTYAKDVSLELKEYDPVFSDNWFDINGNEPICITIEKSTLPKDFTASKIKNQLQIMSAYEVGK